MPMPEAFTKKIGPLKAWQWGVLGVPVFYLTYRWNKNRATSTGAATVTGVTDGTGTDVLPPDTGTLVVPESTNYAPDVSPVAGQTPVLDYGYTTWITDPGYVPMPPTAVEATPTTQAPPSNTVQPLGTGHCPAGYCMDANGRCQPKVFPLLPCRQQPGASAAGGAGAPRKCPKGQVWNGFTCVKEYVNA